MNPFGSQSDTHFWPSAEMALLLTFILGLLALWKPTLGENAFRRIEKSLSFLAEHKTLAVCLMFMVVGVIRLAVLPLWPVPIPGIHASPDGCLYAGRPARTSFTVCSTPISRRLWAAPPRLTRKNRATSLALTGTPFSASLFELNTGLMRRHGAACQECCNREESARRLVATAAQSAGTRRTAL
jgi:hypothetical protein